MNSKDKENKPLNYFIKLQGILGSLTKRELFLPVLSFLAMYVISSSISPAFLTPYNQFILLLQSVPLMLLALGESLIILMGSIDLSPGSVMALTGIISAMLIKYYRWIPGISILIGIAVGSLIGFLNGIAVTKAKIFSFVTTLATLVMGRGLVLIITKGSSITGLVEFRIFTYTTFLMLPIMIWILIAFVIIIYFIAKYTSIGLVLYAIGGNEDAVRISGISADLYKVVAFTMAGTLYGIAGQIMNARLEIAYPWTGWGAELDAIASCVLGGYYLSGGVGNPIGALIGAYVLTLIANIFVLLGLDPYFQWIVKGVILLGIATVLTRGAKFVK
jgi:ribose transport system permease protein